MRRITSSLVLVGCLVVVAATADARRRPRADCPADPAGSVSAACPCDGRALGDGSVTPWSTHGEYVACVTRAACGLRRSRCAPAGAKLRLVRCAARSICGRAGAVVCQGSRSGTLRVVRSAERCIAMGGVVTTARSACDGWVSVTTTTNAFPVATSTTTSTAPSTTTTTLAALGNDVEFPYASSHAPGYLLGGPIVVPRPVTVTQLAVIAKAPDAQVVLALYTDAGGAPDALVASTPPTVMVVGRNEIDVPAVSLAPGTYWLMGTYDTDTSIGFDTAAGVPVRYVEHAFGEPLPSPLGGSWSYEGQRFNYYVRGR